MDDLTISEQLALMAAWSPNDVGRDDMRWRSWSEFLGTYQEVRSELEATFSAGPDDTFFAARSAAFAATHGLEALEYAPHEEISSYAGGDDAAA